MKPSSVKPLPVGYPVYHAISQLNRSFEESIQAFEHVMSFNLFPPDQLKAYQVMLEEIRALANQDFTEIISERELRNSAYYERLRLISNKQVAAQESANKHPKHEIERPKRPQSQRKQRP